MRPTRQALTLRRKQLDRLLRSTTDLEKLSIPPGGWLRAIRQALGMSSYQLASRAGLEQSTVRDAEAREATGGITLGNLRKLAANLECDLVYALVPRHGTLEETLRARALAVAQVMVGSVQHTMNLEAQEIGAEQHREMIQELAEELMQSQSRELWTTAIES
jgi:predicted DNA-binding mobile mystery protein A